MILPIVVFRNRLWINFNCQHWKNLGGKPIFNNIILINFNAATNNNFVFLEKQIWISRKNKLQDGTVVCARIMFLRNFSVNDIVFSRNLMRHLNTFILSHYKNSLIRRLSLHFWILKLLKISLNDMNWRQIIKMMQKYPQRTDVLDWMTGHR